MYLSIDGAIELPKGMSEDKFWDLFFPFLEDNGMSFGGVTELVENNSDHPHFNDKYKRMVALLEEYESDEDNFGKLAIASTLIGRLVQIMNEE